MISEAELIVWIVDTKQALKKAEKRKNADKSRILTLKFQLEILEQVKGVRE